jgi:hypothetical protein
MLVALLTACVIREPCESTATSEVPEGSETPPVEVSRPDCEEDFALQEVTVDSTVEAGCVTRVLDDVEIGEGATLTVEAGAWLEFAGGAALWVGSPTSGRLVVEGTADRPVMFTALDGPVRGAWGGVVLDDDPLPETTLRHVVIEYAGEPVGGNGDAPGALMVMWPDELAEGHVILDHVTFRHNAHGGVNLFSDNSNGVPGALVPSDVTFEDNGGLSIRWYPDGIADLGPDTVADEPVWVTPQLLFDTRPWTPPAPVILEQGLTVADGGELHLTGGELLFPRGTDLDLTDGGIFLDDVRLASAAATPVPGDWGGVTVSFPAGPLVLDGCTIEHADADEYGVISIFDGPETVFVDGTTFQSNIGYADIWGAGDECVRLSASGNTFDLLPCE